jgi:hypothetical protein
MFFFTQKLHVQKENKGDGLGPRPILNNCHFAEPPCCSLYTNVHYFLYIYVVTLVAGLTTVSYIFVHLHHGLISHKDTKAKSRHLIKFTCTLTQGRGSGGGELNHREG